MHQTAAAPSCSRAPLCNQFNKKKKLTKVCKVLPVTVLAPPHVDELVVAHDVAQGKGAEDPSVPGRQDAAGVDAVQGGRNDAVEVAAQSRRPDCPEYDNKLLLRYFS